MTMTPDARPLRRLPEAGDAVRGRSARRPAERSAARTGRRQAALYRLFAGAGFPERSDLVRQPGAVPQLADADAVFPAIAQRPGVRYIALVPNERGLDRAIAAGVDDIAVFTAASRNVRAAQHPPDDRRVACDLRRSSRARARDARARVGLDRVRLPLRRRGRAGGVVRVARALLDLGGDELSIADTIGFATPEHVSEVARKLQAEMPVERLAMDFYDTHHCAGQRARGFGGQRGDLRRFERRFGRMSLCTRRDEPGHRRPVAHAPHHEPRDRGRSGAVRAASRFIAGVLERPA